MAKPSPGAATATFMSLDDDIIILIYEQLKFMSESYAISLPMVSKHLKSLLWPIHMRTMKLWDREVSRGTEWEQRRMRALRGAYGGVWEKMGMEKGDERLRMTREIIVQGVRDEKSSCNDDGFVEFIVGYLEGLSDFVWASPKPIPKSLATLLESRWPNARLRVPSQRVEGLDPETRWDLDEVLLGSSGLYELDLDMFWAWVRCSVTGDSRKRLFSLLPRIGQLLERSKRLRILKIGFDAQRMHGFWNCVIHNAGAWNGWAIPENEITLTDKREVAFPDGFQLPQLKKLVRPVRDISSESVRFLEVLTRKLLFTHLPRWMKGLQALKDLELHGLSERLPFAQLKGRTPNLRSVDLVLHEDDILEGLEFVRSLSVGVLSDLRISDWSTLDVHEIWSVVKKFRGSLRRLAVGKKMGREILKKEKGIVLRRGDVEDLLGVGFPILRHLEIDISLADALWFAILKENSPITSEDIKAAEEAKLIAPLLAQLAGIQILRLTVRLPATSSSILHRAATLTRIQDPSRPRLYTLSSLTSPTGVPDLHLPAIRSCLANIIGQMFLPHQPHTQISDSTSTQPQKKNNNNEKIEREKEREKEKEKIFVNLMRLDLRFLTIEQSETGDDGELRAVCREFSGVRMAESERVGLKREKTEAWGWPMTVVNNVVAVGGVDGVPAKFLLIGLEEEEEKVWPLVENSWVNVERVGYRGGDW